eukprot:TRINITY_DN17126_c0_g1_i1.p1 TRINITY_DN17126_c0_g1~~TRINITY_DN17126_c0_g1_i1.p1  ORF type:complete len:291 (+),score=51.43 TRINITY_DN17126_c0_g1_i1:3-875(+)
MIICISHDIHPRLSVLESPILSLHVFFFFFLMIRRPPRSTLSSSSAASDVYKRQVSTQSTGNTALSCCCWRMPKEAQSEACVNSLNGWRKAVKRVASLEETALCEIDGLYDHLIPGPEQQEWIQEKIRLLKEEADAIADGSHSGLRSRWEVLERMRQKKVAAAERHSNRQVESIKKLFESELLQAADECESEKLGYQQELLDTFQRRYKRLDDDLKVLEKDGTLAAVNPQPPRKIRVRRGGGDADSQQPATRRRIQPFQTLMESGIALKDEEIEDDLNMMHRLSSKIGSS